MKENSGFILRVILLLIVADIFIICHPNIAQTKVDKIDELLNRYYEIGKFNGCILVAENGKIIYRNALGFADADRQEKLTLDHSFRLASVSKQFTAMAVMLLQERSKLNYEDNIRQYIPELSYQNVTIRHLLTHTSGLPDYHALLDEYWDPANRDSPQRKVATNKDVLTLLVEKQPPPKFNPGDRFEYCNTGYMLLALAVERVSGQRFQEFMKTHIFEPLEMSRTYINEPSGILPEKQRAHGFRENPIGAGFIADDHHYQNGMYGDGGVISTVNDMFKWDQALYSETLVSHAALEKAFTPAILNDSSTVDYGFGWSIIPGEEGIIAAHGGGWLGFQAFFLRDMAAKHSVIQLCNMPGIRKGELAFTIYDILHDRQYSLPVKEQIVFQVDMRIPLQHRVFKPLNGDQLLLRGNFNGWTGNAEVLSDPEADSIYTITHDVIGSAGDAIQYKFVIHQSGGTDIWEENPEPENFPYGNRRLILQETPQILAAVAFDLDKYRIDYQFPFTVQEVQEDFQDMQKTIEGLHPALYEFTDKITYDAIFEEQFKSIDRDMTGQEFYRIAAPLVARIGCGHSTISVPESWWDNAPDRFFPLRLQFLHNKTFVLQAYEESGMIPSGSEIVSINDMPVSSITEQLLAGISADGYNRGYRIDHLNRRFPYLYALHHGFPEGFRVTYRHPDSSQMRSILLSPVSGATLAAANPWRTILTFDLLKEKSTAILKINNFNYYREEEKFFAFVDSAFNKIQQAKIQNLILDLRDNDGGDPFCTAHLLSYLAPRPIPYFAEPYGKYAELAKPIPLTDQRFEGNLFILINSRCFSSTAHLCALLKFHNIGTFVGSETGGTYTCNDAKTIIPLKNTRLRLQVAQGSFTVAVADMPKNRGILPDYPVEPGIEDLIEARDTILEYTLNLIEKMNSGE